jgi:ATP synthase protein I
MPEESKGNRARPDELSPEEKAQFERRLKELGGKLGKSTASSDKEAEAEEDRRLQRQGMSYGLRMASELVAAVAVGGLIGYGLDHWVFGDRSWPWLFLVFFFLGCAAGAMNVWRSFKRLEAEVARRTKGNIGKDLPDDDD